MCKSTHTWHVGGFALLTSNINVEKKTQHKTAEFMPPYINLSSHYVHKYETVREMPDPSSTRNAEF